MDKSEPVCGKEALELLNCVTNSSFDQEKCVNLLNSLRKCVLDKVSRKIQVLREMDVDPIEVLLDQNENVTNEVNGGGNNGDDGEEIEFVDSVETSDEWTAWRDTLAHEMYDVWREGN